MQRRARLYADTSADAEQVLLAIYRRMPAWRKVELVEDANRTARQWRWLVCDRATAASL